MRLTKFHHRPRLADVLGTKRTQNAASALMQEPRSSEKGRHATLSLARTSMDPSITAEEIQRRIRTRAYAIWQAEGKPEGMDVKHWLMAEREVLEQVDRSGATGPAVDDAAARVPRRSADPNVRQDDLLDEAVEETFPASDPISPKRIT